MIKTITSRQNQEIKAVASLAQRSERYGQGRFIAEGLRICATLIDSPITLTQLYCLESHLTEAKKIAPYHLITCVAPEVMEKISQASTPSGILGVFEMPQNHPASSLTSGLVLVRIADPGNMGTLMRSAAAFGVQSVVVVEGCDPWAPKTVQASAGTLGSLSIFPWSWQELLEHKKDLLLCALVVEGGNSPEALDLKNSLLVVGNEADGIPREWLANCEQSMTLSMPGNTESLNAAVAGSLALYVSRVAKKC